MPANRNLALLSELYTLVNKFSDDITYTIHVDFGEGLYFDRTKNDKSNEHEFNIK